ncbi:hypothetical protein NLX85_18095 [Micromonospora sp. A3M-1-15]|uniref:hypothetical protein n=1 Tax=Micromonospora sp. A3M-1-15 TaxID=2962035 RepID=UPI0020B6C711|nr:hypothetical protein [Micromonospora sp. A3M-1-15]MCP3785280.1 hypothetical protein [Micromonospora sp. A3M-1-15]
MLLSGTALRQPHRLDLDLLDRHAVPHERGLRHQVRTVVAGQVGLRLAGDHDGQVDGAGLQRRAAGVPVGAGVQRAAVERVHRDVAAGQVVLADEPLAERGLPGYAVQQLVDEVLDDALVLARCDHRDPGSFVREELDVERPIRGQATLELVVGLVAGLVEPERRRLIPHTVYRAPVARTDRLLDGGGQPVGQQQRPVLTEPGGDVDRLLVAAEGAQQLEGRLVEFPLDAGAVGAGQRAQDILEGLQPALQPGLARVHGVRTGGVAQDQVAAVHPLDRPGRAPVRPRIHVRLRDHRAGIGEHVLTEHTDPQLEQLRDGQVDLAAGLDADDHTRPVGRAHRPGIQDELGVDVQPAERLRPVLTHERLEQILTGEPGHERDRLPFAQLVPPAADRTQQRLLRQPHRQRLVLPQVIRRRGAVRVSAVNDRDALDRVPDPGDDVTVGELGAQFGQLLG